MAPYLAIIFSHVYEKYFISYLIASGKTEEAMKLSNTFRFQGDLIVMNDNGFSDTIYKDKYPSELTFLSGNIPKIPSHGIYMS